MDITRSILVELLKSSLMYEMLMLREVCNFNQFHPYIRNSKNKKAIKKALRVRKVRKERQSPSFVFLV